MPTKKAVREGEFVAIRIMSIMKVSAATPVLDAGIRRVS